VPGWNPSIDLWRDITMLWGLKGDSWLVDVELIKHVFPCGVLLEREREESIEKILCSRIFSLVDLCFLSVAVYGSFPVSCFNQSYSRLVNSRSPLPVFIIDRSFSRPV
jgi:hypothetical protein